MRPAHLLADSEAIRLKEIIQHDSSLTLVVEGDTGTGLVPALPPLGANQQLLYPLSGRPALA
jgi:hypothetical protein